MTARTKNSSLLKVSVYQVLLLARLLETNLGTQF